MSLTFLGTSYKWNHAISVFLCWLISLSMSSRFIHVVPCITISFLLRLNKISLHAYTTFCLHVYILSNICIVSTFWLFWIMLWRWAHKYLFKSLLSTLLVIYSEMNLAYCMVMYVYFFEEPLLFFTEPVSYCYFNLRIFLFHFILLMFWFSWDIVIIFLLHFYCNFSYCNKIHLPEMSSF